MIQLQCKTNGELTELFFRVISPDNNVIIIHLTSVCDYQMKLFSGISTHLTNKKILRKWMNLICLPKTTISHLTSENRQIPAGLSNLWRLLPAANSGIFLQGVFQNIALGLYYMVSKYHRLPLNLRTWTKNEGFQAQCHWTNWAQL